MLTPQKTSLDPTAAKFRRLRRRIPLSLWMFVAILVLVAIASVLWVDHPRTVDVANVSHFGLEQLPRFQQRAFGSQPHIRVQQRAFRPEPYICAAAALQTMGRDRACEQMMAFVERDRDAEQVFILCRMLFTKRGESEFRRPEIGGATFLGDTTYADWPLEPIELVDSVPFVITWGYKLGGEAESPESYLRYCMANCDWNTIRYREQNRAEIRAALTTLLASSKWQRPLETQERERLTEQVE